MSDLLRVMFDELLNVIDKAGTVGILVFLIVTGARAWWVFGWQYRSLVQDRDEWKRLALRGTRLLELKAQQETGYDADH